MNRILDSIVAALNTPVPHVATTSDAGLYLFDALGFFALAVGAWWIFCFVVRNGIDGTKAAARALYNRKSIPLRLILLNRWKIRGSAEDTTGPVDLRCPVRDRK